MVNARINGCTGAAAALLLAGILSAGNSLAAGSGNVDKVTLGVLTDQSGVYASHAGKFSIAAAKIAVDDFKAKYGNKSIIKSIEVINADTKNNPSLAAREAKRMYTEQGVNAILDVPASNVGLAVAKVALAQKRIYINSGAGTTRLTGDQCNKYTFAWGYSTYELASSTGKAITESGDKTWAITYPDYVYGQDMDHDFTAAIEKAGGKVVKHYPTPFPNSNFSTYLLGVSALDPRPTVLGVMQSSGDLVSLVKQYNQFGLRSKNIGLALGLLFLPDIKSIGVESLAGTRFTVSWYWDMNPEARKLGTRIYKMTGGYPAYTAAAVYSSALQYLEAVQNTGTTNSDTISKYLAGRHISDAFVKNGYVQANHRLVFPTYLAQVKNSADVKGEDYLNIIKTNPADESFLSVAESGCKMPQ